LDKVFKCNPVGNMCAKGHIHGINRPRHPPVEIDGRKQLFL
jgi:hypothetical protein